MIASTFLIDYGWQSLTLVLCLLASAFFSGTETAMFTLSRTEVHRLWASGRLGRLTARLVRRPRRLLNTLLLGNMLVNIAFTATAAVIILEFQPALREPWLVALISVAPFLAVLLVGEVMPKLLAYTIARRWAVLAAGPVYVVQRLLLPALWMLDHLLVDPITRIVAPHPAEPGHITAEELAGLIHLSARRGILDHDTGEMLQEIMELTDMTAAEVMVPRVDMVAYDVEAPPAGLMECFRRTGFRTIPVFDKDLDDVLGVAPAKRLLLNPRTPLRELIQPVTFLPETANLEQVLTHFRKTHQKRAIIVDEYGGTAGLITLQDVLEEIVGDIPDIHEARTTPPVREIGPAQYVLAGNLSVRDWADAFNIRAEGGRISTLGGLVTSWLGRIPREGDALKVQNLRFTVEKMRRRRVESIRLELTGGRP